MSLKGTPCPEQGCSARIVNTFPMTCEDGHQPSPQLVALAASRALADAHPAAPARNGNGSHGNLASLASLASEPTHTEKASKRETAGGFKLASLTVLRTAPVDIQEWLVDGLLVRGGSSLWAAKPKVGKTVTIRNLARCVAAGEPFLGRRVRQGLVIILALEERPSKVRAHLAQLGAPDPEIDERILIHVGAAPDDAVGELRDLVIEHTPDLVIVDTLGKLARFRDVNDYSEVTRVLEPITEVARQSGCHIALLHHLGKMERADNGDEVLGSTALTAAVDTIVLMKRGTDGTRTIKTIQRDGEDLDETVLSYDTSVGRCGLGGTVAEERHKQARKAIVEVLGQANELTEPDIRDRVSGNNRVVGPALRSLVADRHVAKLGAGRKGDPFRYALPGRESPADSSFLAFSSSGGSEKASEARYEDQAPTCANCGVMSVDQPGLNCDHCMDGGP